jgi:D-lactate dehydrogenase
MNFSLEGLLGFDLHGRTVGVVGTGRIGEVVCSILRGFGCRLIAHDMSENPRCLELGVRYLPMAELMEHSDIVTLHCPLTPQTYHMIDRQMLKRARPGFMLINTSRGGLIETSDVIEALKNGRIGYLGLDVYEEEEALFFEDRSTRVLVDDVFARLLTFPNVVITGHQAYFTEDALRSIAETTLSNISLVARGETCPNAVQA